MYVQYYVNDRINISSTRACTVQELYWNPWITSGELGGVRNWIEETKHLHMVIARALICQIEEFNQNIQLVDTFVRHTSVDDLISKF